jgi:adenosylcobinamide-GDP ribazoletransferase
VAAALALALQALLTGALHEDGLADCADGFWGGGTPERRLEIMRDSRIGSYGVLALVLTLLVRWSSLAALPPAALLPVLAAAGALSRAPMGLGMAVLPFARAGGLAVAVGRPPLPAAVLGLVLSLLAAAVLLGSAAALPALAGLAAAAAVACLARAKIGGQTGDVVGAMQQAAEATALAAAAALLTGG